MTVGRVLGAWRHPRISANELRRTQDRKLRRIIRHAYDQVPYYRALFQSVGLTPEDVLTTDDLHKIPPTDKGNLVEAGVDACLAQGARKNECIVSRTSGSSGEPHSTYLTRREHRIRRALGWRRLLDAGVQPWDRVCVISDPARARSRRFRTQVVPVAWSPREQLSLLQNVQPMVLKAWPSSVTVLIHQAQHRLARHIRPRIVALSGEQCSESLRQQIQSDLGAEVFIFYGAGEFGPIASECPAHDGLHISTDELIVESLNGARTSPCGELLITSLFARTMPYIRYRTGDLGTVCDDECSCGNSLPRLTRLRGQASRMIRLPGGERASVAAVVNTSLRCFPTLRKFCLIQNAIDEFMLQAVFLEPPDRNILQLMERRIRECLFNDVGVRISVVNSIDVESARKFGNFICRLPEDVHREPRASMGAEPLQRSDS